MRDTAVSCKINTRFTYRINLAQRPANMVVTSNMQQRTKRQPTKNHEINNAQRTTVKYTSSTSRGHGTMVNAAHEIAPAPAPPPPPGLGSQSPRVSVSALKSSMTLPSGLQSPRVRRRRALHCCLPRSARLISALARWRADTPHTYTWYTWGRDNASSRTHMCAHTWAQNDPRVRRARPSRAIQGGHSGAAAAAPCGAPAAGAMTNVCYIH